MRIFKNNQEITIEKLTKIRLEENETIQIEEYIRFFEPELYEGTLILHSATFEIHIEHITNVLNLSNASVEFNDCLIDSMDELFELIKHSLGDEFYVDIDEMLNEDKDSFTFALYEDLEEAPGNISEKTDEKVNLLINISTTNIDSILNFPLIYTNQNLNNSEWQHIHLLFWGSAINCLKESEKLKKTIISLKKNGIELSYYSLDEIDEVFRYEIEDIGFDYNHKNRLLTDALKSSKWSVLTV